MVTLPSSVKIYLALDPTDMRKQIDGLSAIVQGKWKIDPYCGHLFVFISRRQDRVKILYFDHGGFVVYYKRLEAGRFRIPAVPTGSTRVMIEASDLQMLLRGIDFSRVRRNVPWIPSGDTMGTPPPQLGVDKGIRL
jgi:transposase